MNKYANKVEETVFRFLTTGPGFDHNKHSEISKFSEQKAARKSWEGLKKHSLLSVFMIFLITQAIGLLFLIGITENSGAEFLMMRLPPMIICMQLSWFYLLNKTLIMAYISTVNYKHFYSRMINCVRVMMFSGFLFVVAVLFSLPYIHIIHVWLFQYGYFLFLCVVLMCVIMISSEKDSVGLSDELDRKGGEIIKGKIASTLRRSFDNVFDKESGSKSSRRV